jgi:hypothetical protein
MFLWQDKEDLMEKCLNLLRPRMEVGAQCNGTVLQSVY